MITLPIVWYLIICLELALYVLLDGANLGVGIVSLFPQQESKRASMLTILGPIWNANETWLLVAAGTLFGAFPAVYSIGLNALYLPGVIILIGLILRAVSFEFHAFSVHKRPWSFAFGLGSLITAVGHGAALGGLLSGIAVADGHFAGGPLSWATPLTGIIIVGVVASYLVLGYAYLIRRMAYENQHETFSRLLTTVGITFVALAIATLFLPVQNFLFFTRWVEPPSMYYLTAIAVGIVIASAFLLHAVIRHRHAERLYTLALIIFGLGFVGMLIGTYPYLMPPSITLFEAASPHNTLVFMLWGIGPILPIVLLYNIYLSRVFRSGAHEVRANAYDI